MFNRRDFAFTYFTTSARTHLLHDQRTDARVQICFARMKRAEGSIKPNKPLHVRAAICFFTSRIFISNDACLVHENSTNGNSRRQRHTSITPFSIFHGNAKIIIRASKHPASANSPFGVLHRKRYVTQCCSAQVVCLSFISQAHMKAHP